MPNYVYIFAGILIAAALVIGIETWRIHSLDSDIAALQSENDKLTDANKAFASSVDEQNAEIAKWKLTADSNVKTAQAAIAQADKQVEAYKANAHSIQTYKPTGDQCKDVAAIVKRFYAGAGQ